MSGQQREEIYQLIENCVRHKNFNAAELAIVKHVIFKTADFDYANTLAFSEGAADLAVDALFGGSHMITDSKMTHAGIRRDFLEYLGISCACIIAEEENYPMPGEAQKGGNVSAINEALLNEQNRIFVFSNTPAALLYFLDQVRHKNKEDYVVVAAPVGFVDVVESKEILKRSGVPYLMVEGQKGGMNVAAEIVNTLLSMACEKKALEAPEEEL